MEGDEACMEDPISSILSLMCDSLEASYKLTYST